MARFSEYGRADILRFQDEARASLQNSPTLQAAAQRLTERIYDTFSESVVLTRFFVTAPVRHLPAGEHAFAETIAAAKNTSLTEDTLALVLLGTSGRQARWNDRRLSVGHRAIPLLSAAFIESVPMVARLLRELGFEPDWFTSGKVAASPLVESRVSAGEAGIFYVRDAASAKDSADRFVISAQDFVREHKVRTVFGLGGVYPDGTMLAVLVFADEFLEPEIIEGYTHLVSLIKAATTGLVREGAVLLQS